MIQIKNKLKCPVQLIVKSRRQPRAFTTLNVPGIGKGKNIVVIDDEIKTEYIDRLEKCGIISTKYISNKENIYGV